MLGVSVAGTTGCKFGDDNGGGGGGIDAGLDAPALQNPLLTATPSTEDFGTVNVGAQSASTMVVIANVGTGTSGPITTSLTGDATFAIDSDGCNGMSLASAKGCTIAVHYAPTASGANSATLSVTATPGGSLTVPLAGTGAAPGALSISPTAKDLGSLVIGSTSMPATFTVTNNGGSASGAVTLALTGTDADEFAIGMDQCSGKVLPPKATCTATVSITPTSAGAKAGSLTAKAVGDMGTATASLSATALPGAGFSIKPATYDFGSVPQGSMTPPGQTFTVENLGGVPSAAPTVAVSGPNKDDFAISNNMCTSAIMPLATCTFSVIFGPTTPSTESATLTVSATGATSGTATLSGTGVGSAALTITPTSQPFAPIVQGGLPSSDVGFTVKNTGTIATGALAVALGGTNADQFGLGTDGCTGQMLGAGATCTVNAHFAPTLTGAVGDLLASLTVSGMPGGAAAATLTGTALAPAQLTMAPASQGLGTVAQGKTGSDFPFQVTNTGGVASGAIAVGLAGTNKGDFGLGMDGCTGQTLAAGASCTVNAHFAPSATSAGAEQATLTASAAPGGSASANLTATSFVPADIAFTETAASFGQVLQGALSLGITLTLKNSGGSDSGPVTLSLGGTNPGQFLLLNDHCTGASLTAHGGTCTVAGEFAPSTGTRGIEVATLTASASPGGSAAANFYGDGLAPAKLSLSQPAKPPAVWTRVPVQQGPAGPVTLTITNLGDVPSGTISYAFPGTGPNDPYTDDFYLNIESFPCSTPLPGGQTCSFPVVFDPSTAAAKEIEPITVTANPGGTATSTLEGTGLWVLTVNVNFDASCAATTSGSVSSTPAPGISCALPATAGTTNVCTATYVDQTPVGVIPTGDLTGTLTGCFLNTDAKPPQCSFLMTSNVNVTADFCIPIIP
jgi:hypothetical protein